MLNKMNTFEQEENKNQSVPTVAPTIKPLTTFDKLMIQIW
jgi:hypothetical protein